MSDQDVLDYQAEMVFLKTKQHLITMMGRTFAEANADEFYRALSYTLREQIMINWLSSIHTMNQKNARVLYYFSMEYLPGRIFTANMANLCENNFIKMVLSKANRSFREVTERESDPGLGNGGLGRLASCLLDSLATLRFPAQGYGLRYQYGIFEQQLWNGRQIEAPDCWLINENPWELRRDLNKVVVTFRGTPTTTYNVHGDEISTLKDEEKVFAVPYDFPIVGYSKDKMFSVLTLRLWTTNESPRNFQLQRYNIGRLDEAVENTILTDVLYPTDSHDIGKRSRLKQEFLLVSSSLQDIIRRYLTLHENFNSLADKVRIQINDTHPSLVVAELIRLLTHHYHLPWKTAFEITQACTGYTNHTVLSEALEVWDKELLQRFLPSQYKIIERLNYEFCNSIRARYPSNEEKIRRMSIIEGGKVRMANLAFYGAHRINGVAQLHTEILKNDIFKDFADMFPERLVNITNGITPRRWLLQANPELASFITKRIGDGWTTDFSQIKQLEKFALDDDSLNELIMIKKKNKQRFVDFLDKNYRLHNADGEITGRAPKIDVNSLFDVQVKRFHEYKRQLLFILHLVMVYQEMLAQPESHNRVPRTAIIAGKAAPGYETAKDIMQFIHCVARKVNSDPVIKGALKIVFVENYNVTKAEIIMPAADLSEQISTAGMEASGTGNMKLTINGALTIGTRDGANIEMEQEIGSAYWPFAFGCSSEQIEKMRLEKTYNPLDICNKNPKIKQAVASMVNHTFTQSEAEHQVFANLHRNLIESGNPPDRYFILADLENFYETQLKVEALYRKPLEWAKYTLHNIAGMGKFSSDRTVQEYAEKVWDLTPCPIDNDLYAIIEKEFCERDQFCCYT